LVEKLRASRNPKREEDAACLTERFPPDSKQGDPTNLGTVAAVEPQTSGGVSEQASGASDGDGCERRHGSEGGR
jgi:hypothetical protein